MIFQACQASSLLEVTERKTKGMLERDWSNFLIQREYKHEVPDFSLSFGSRNLPHMYAKVSYLF